MSSERRRAVLVGGSAVVAMGASFGSWVPGFPAIWSTASLPFVVVAWATGVPLWVSPILVSSAYVAWALPYSREWKSSVLVLVAAAIIGGLSLAYYASSYSRAFQYQDPLYFLLTSLVGLPLYAGAMICLLVSRKRRDPLLHVGSVAILLCWMSWLAFPYFGELP